MKIIMCQWIYLRNYAFHQFQLHFFYNLGTLSHDMYKKLTYSLILNEKKIMSCFNNIRNLLFKENHPSFILKKTTDRILYVSRLNSYLSSSLKTFLTFKTLLGKRCGASKQQILRDSSSTILV